MEPDLSRPWNINVWLYGLRIPFSLVSLSWITFAQVLSPRFNSELYLYVLIATTFGLVVGAHYIDIATSKEKFSPYFKVPTRGMLAAGLASVLIGALTGVYISLRWNQLFIVFVGIESFAAIAYPRSIPKVAHSYASFAMAWGAIPFLAAYFIQAGTISLAIVGLSTFIGFSSLMMHHLAVMTRESSDWQNAVYLLALYRYAVYLLGLLALLGRLVSL